MSWFTAAELAKMALPGIPSTDRAVRTRAERECWQGRRRQGRGGGTEYHIDSLPEAARAAVLLRQARASDPNPRPSASPAGAEGAPYTRAAAPAAGDPANTDPQAEEQAWVEGLWRRYRELPDNLKARARARLDAVQEVQRLIEARVKKTVAYREVALQRDVSQTSLRGWWKTVEGQRVDVWLPLLADRYVAGGKPAECHPRAWEHYKADYLRQSRPSHAACYRRLERKAAAEGWTIPEPRTLQRWIEELPEGIRILARQGNEALKRRFPSQRRDRAVFHALEAVNADGHTFDVFVRWPDGTIRRPVMLAWQDLYSGKILAWRIGESENADLVRLSLGDLVETYGLPDDAYLDNGRAFASKWLTGGMATRYRFKVKAEEPTGVLTTLGVRVHWVTPYHGQAKPIERAFRDLCEDIAKHPACEGAYTGNKPEAKPENYGSKAVPLADFLELVRTEIAHHNARPARRTQVCDGRKSFDQAFADSFAEAPIRRATAAQRDLWLLAAEGVTVRRTDGTIHLMENRYWSAAIAHHAGHKVTVRFDPQALHEGLHVYAQDGRYLGYAECFEAVGFNDAAKAREQTKARQAWTKAHREMLDAQRRMSAAEVAKGLPDAPEPETPHPSVVRPTFGRGGAAPAVQVEATAQAEEQEDIAVRQLRGLQLIHGDRSETAGD